MFPTLVSILLACTAAALLLHVIGIACALRFSARKTRTVDDAALPPLSLLKPMKGLEESLEANLRSFYSQDYPAQLQIVFASTEANDPAMAVAKRIARDYPHVESRFVLSSDHFGLNPKVSNMHGALTAARHELVLQSDANVWLAPGYLRKLVGAFIANDADMAGGLVVGIGEKSVFAALDNIQLSAFTSPAICIAHELANVSCVLGKSMLLKQSALRDIGGLEAVKDVLAEDFVLADSFARAGKKVLLTNLPVFNVNEHSSLHKFMGRHSRWLKMRAVISVPGYIADIFANPGAFVLLAWLASGFDVNVLGIVAAVLAYKSVADALLAGHLRGTAWPLRYLWVTPLRDVLLGGLWFYAAFSRTTEWRGEVLRIGHGSVLERESLLPLPMPDGSAHQAERSH